jgi:hypothetical protein
MTTADSISRASGFAIATETTPGTAETVPEVYDYLTSSPNINPVVNTMIHRSILSRSAHNASVASYHVEGSIETIADPDSILGYLLKFGLGSVTSAQVGVTTAYEHTFTPTDELPTFTTWLNRGSAQKVKMAYCMSNGFTLTQAVDDVLKVSTPFIAQAEVETTDFGTPSFTNTQPFANANLAVSVNSAAVTEAHNSTLTVANGIDVASGRVHGERSYTALVPGDRTITGSLNLYFNDASMYKLFWGATDATTITEKVLPVPITLTWTHAEEAGAGEPYSLEVTIPSAILTNTSVDISGTRVVQTVDFEAIYDSDEATDIEVVLVNKVDAY